MAAVASGDGIWGQQQAGHPAAIDGVGGLAQAVQGSLPRHEAGWRVVPPRLGPIAHTAFKHVFQALLGSADAAVRNVGAIK